MQACSRGDELLGLLLVALARAAERRIVEFKPQELPDGRTDCFISPFKMDYSDRLVARKWSPSTEELKLATGASAPVARKRISFEVISIKGIMKGMYTVFLLFFKQKCPPPFQCKFQIFNEQIGFCPAPRESRVGGGSRVGGEGGTKN